MFDIGFWELTLIGVVALLVVGPERFPGMVRGAGVWVGKFRAMANNVKEEIKTEVDKAEQLQRLVEEQKDILKRTEDQFQQAVSEVESETSRPRAIPLSNGAPSLNKAEQIEAEKAAMVQAVAESKPADTAAKKDSQS